MSNKINKKMTTNKTYRKELHAIIKETFSQLKQLKAENNRIAFDQAMRKILPGLKRYITRWMENAIYMERIPKGKYKIDDFVDELYILAYDHIHEVKEDKNLYNWLFKKADELLEDTEVEEDFDNFFFKNIDNYTHAEWDEMEEKFSIDGGGDFVMEEELDDVSYSKNNYVLQDVFVEDKDQEIIEQLNQKLNDEKINRHFNMVLHQLSRPIRTVFDLYARQQFIPEEIAKIKKISIAQVEQYLTEAKEIIKVSFEKRYVL